MARSSIARSTGVTGAPSFPEPQAPEGLQRPKSASGERAAFGRSTFDASGEKGAPARDSADAFEKPSGKGGTNPKLALVKDPPAAPAADPGAKPPAAEAKPADAPKPADQPPAVDQKPADAPKPVEAKPAEAPKPPEDPKAAEKQKLADEARKALDEERKIVLQAQTYEVKKDTMMRQHHLVSDYVATMGELQTEHFKNLKRIRGG